MDLAELRIRYARQSAKALSNQRNKTGLQEKVTNDRLTIRHFLIQYKIERRGEYNEH